MSITKEDILRVATLQEQADMFSYWSPDEDHVYKTPTQMVKEYQKVTEQNAGPGLYGSLIKEEFGEWVAEHHQINGSRTAELKELADLLYVVYGYAVVMGWDLEGALVRIHENNLGRMRQPDGTIKRREDGKIEKNKDYPKPNLEDLI